MLNCVWWGAKDQHISSVYDKEKEPLVTDRSVTDHETSTWSSRAAASTQTVQPLIVCHSAPPPPMTTGLLLITASSSAQEKFCRGRRRWKRVKENGAKKAPV